MRSGHVLMLRQSLTTNNLNCVTSLLRRVIATIQTNK